MKETDRLEHREELMKQTVVWDNHACMPLRPGDNVFLPHLERHKKAGVSVVILNVAFDVQPWYSGFTMLAAFRHWLQNHADEYVLAESVSDIECARLEGKMAVLFDIEGGKAVEEHPGLVEVFYMLGVRWMLIAYNKNNRLGGGCQDKDSGLTDYGRRIIDEMERVGMVLCCSHTGYQTAREAMEYANNPVIFSHSNPRSMWDHPRNLPDDLLYACAGTGGVVNISGVGPFLGNNDNSTETIVRHIDYVTNLIGYEHVGLGLDYAFDQQEVDNFVLANPDFFPPDKGYSAGMRIVAPEQIPLIVDELLRLDYSDEQIQGILGHNNLRVARQVWK